MASYMLEDVASEHNFDEHAYLAANPDIAEAVKTGAYASGFDHFQAFGNAERRRIGMPRSVLEKPKRAKLDRIRPLLRSDLSFVESSMHFDFLSDELRERFNIIDTDAVSSNGYDKQSKRLIEQFEGRLMLDCGAGKRPVYYDHVVNLDIVAYDTTDVRAVAEVLPFVDGAFAAVLSIAVLEHVKDPFLCAKEIARVLKPGGTLLCCVPFLQPVHGYPHHYYNMTNQGLANLFDGLLEISDVAVYEYLLPISSLTWILRSWAEGLHGQTREEFLEMKVRDLMDVPDAYLKRPFVTELPYEKNFELASATVILAHKK